MNCACITFGWSYVGRFNLFCSIIGVFYIAWLINWDEHGGTIQIRNRKFLQNYRNKYLEKILDGWSNWNYLLVAISKDPKSNPSTNDQRS